MIEYSIHMLQIPIKEIQDYSMKKPPGAIEKQQEIFCAGNQDLNYLAKYIDDKLVEQEQLFLILQTVLTMTVLLPEE